MNICWKELHKYMMLLVVYVVSVNEYTQCGLIDGSWSNFYLLLVYLEMCSSPKQKLMIKHGLMIMLGKNNFTNTCSAISICEVTCYLTWMDDNGR
jgi:hypothetical protein